MYISTLKRFSFFLQEYETSLQGYETQVEQLEATCRSGSQFRHLIQRLEEMLEKWDRLWTLAHLYVERLKACEAFLSRIDEADQIVCDVELLLVSHRKLPPSQEDMKRIMKEIKVGTFLCLLDANARTCDIKFLSY